MKLLLDINVVLDVILRRKPWAEDAAKLLSRIERGQAAGYVAGHTITTAYYVVAKTEGRQTATTAISDLLQLVEAVPVGKADFHQALGLGLTDFEDAVQAVCALKIGANYLVTRNEQDFAGLPIDVQPPGVVLAMLDI